MLQSSIALSNNYRSDLTAAQRELSGQHSQKGCRASYIAGGAVDRDDNRFAFPAGESRSGRISRAMEKPPRAEAIRRLLTMGLDSAVINARDTTSDD
jgi:hypothetical protein